MGMMTRRNVKQRAVFSTAHVNTKPKEKNFLDEFAEKMNPPVEKTEVKYTKTEINRMPVAELREIAMRTGVEGADTWNGAELKEYLIAIFGL